MSVIENQDLWELDRQNKSAKRNFEKNKPVLWGFRFTFPNEHSFWDTQTFTIISKDQEIAEKYLVKILSNALQIKPHEIKVDQRGFISKVHFLDTNEHRQLYESFRNQLKSGQANII
jgi:hypothetical protein